MALQISGLLGQVAGASRLRMLGLIFRHEAPVLQVCLGFRV